MLHSQYKGLKSSVLSIKYDGIMYVTTLLLEIIRTWKIIIDMISFYFQGTIAYSTYTPKPENALLNIQAAIIEEIRPERSSIEDLQGNLPTLIIKSCFKYVYQ